MSLPRSRPRSIVAAIVASAVIAMLVACAPDAEPGGASGRDGTPAGPGAQQPTPLLPLACADLVPVADIQAALGEAVEPDDFPFEPGGTWPLSQVGLLQSGSLRCHWSDAADQRGQYPANLELTALPNASEAWSAWGQQLSGWAPASAYGDESFGQCTSSLGGSYRYCGYDLLIGATWVRVEVQNLDGAAATGPADDAALVAPIVSAVADALAGVVSGEAEWRPATSSLDVPATCGGLLATGDLERILATSGMAQREAPPLMPLLYNAGYAGGLTCSWSNAYSSTVPMPISVGLLPGAGWAWEAAWDRPRLDRNPASPLPGLGDDAYSGCASDESDSCFVDVLADGLWLTVSGNKQAGVTGLSALARAALDSLGYASE